MATLKELSTGKTNSITLLRLIAALAVIYGHSYAIVLSGGRDWVTKVTGYAHAGGLAVDFFFLLSGFLVSASITKRGLISYSVSRALRLLPALWVYLILMVFLIAPILTKLTIKEYFSTTQTWNYLFSLGTGTSTEWFLPGVFESNRNTSANGSIWSVILEIRMYLYLALFYMFGMFRSRLIFNFAFGVLVLTVWSGTMEMPGISGVNDIHMSLLFALGCFLYVNKDLVEASPLFILTAFALAGATHGSDKFQYGYILLLTCLFCATAFLRNGSWMDRFGDYSYGVYLWGWPVQQFFATIFPETPAHTNALISMVFALLLAIASWHLIEKQALKLKNRSDQFAKQIRVNISELIAKKVR